MNIIPLFCEIDDCFLDSQKQMLSSEPPEIPDVPKKRGRPRGLHSSEVMTILIAFQQSQYRTLKHFYLKHVCQYWRWAFPKLVNYNRFVELIPETLGSLTIYLAMRLETRSTRIAFIDSTLMPVCENPRIPGHRVFRGIAERTKNARGWSYGFKLHLIVNEHGALMSVMFTPANVDDRIPVAKLTQHLSGNLYGDKGYISKDLAEALKAEGVYLITKVRKNIETQPLSDFDALMLKKRMVIESVIDQLKNQCHLQHTRHRSVVNFQVNAVSAVIAYTHQAKKPSVNLRTLQETKDLPGPFNF
jgi:IS5 family transposase